MFCCVRRKPLVDRPPQGVAPPPATPRLVSEPVGGGGGSLLMLAAAALQLTQTWDSARLVQAALFETAKRAVGGRAANGERPPAAMTTSYSSTAREERP